MISGVQIYPLEQIHDERGKVMHMMRSDSPSFVSFGEIYFSTVHPNAIQAWHLHRAMTVNYAVIFGEIKLVLFDDRDTSSTKGEIQEVFLSTENYKLVTVPPGVWNGFKSIGSGSSIVANCATLPHDPLEISRRRPDDPEIPYNWGIAHG